MNDPGVNLLFGCHPHFADSLTVGRQLLMKKLLKRRDVVGLGEIGLDYSEKNGVNREMQKETFRVQLKMALKWKLPMCLHLRGDDGEGMPIMEQMDVPKDWRIHVHCWNGRWSECQEWLAKYPKCKIGLTMLVTYPRATDIHEVARNIPLDRLVLETDAPYFMPVNAMNFDESNRSEFVDPKTTHPGYLAFVAAEVALLRGITVAEVVEATGKNAIELYGLDKRNRLEEVEEGRAEQRKSGEYREGTRAAER